MKLDNNSKVVILGAGPAGLATAYFLSLHGIKSEIIESSNKSGGLSQSLNFLNENYDLGPHSFYSNYSNTSIEFFKKIIGEENYFKLNPGKILAFKNSSLAIPFQSRNITKFKNAKTGLGIFFSMLNAKFSNKKNVGDTKNIFINKYGKKLHDILFQPYCKKYFNLSSDQISPDFFHLLYDNTKENNNSEKEFLYYPKSGAMGELWDKVEKFITENGSKIHYNSKVEHLETKDGKITGLKTDKNYTIENPAIVVSTIPSTALLKLLNEYENIQNDVQLKFRSTILVYANVNSIHTNALMLTDYNIDSEIGRVTFNYNWKFDREKSNKVVCVEYWCDQNDSVWKQTDIELENKTMNYLKNLKDVSVSEKINFRIIRLPNAYPVLYSGYEKGLEKIKNKLNQYSNLEYLGRHGRYLWDGLDNCIYDAHQIAMKINAGK